MKATAKLIRLDLAAVVDQLGQVKAQIADLKKVEDELKAALVAAGVPEAEGALFRATVSETERSTTDWRAVAEKLEPSRQLVTAHTSTVSATVVRVVARRG